LYTVFATAWKEREGEGFLMELLVEEKELSPMEGPRLRRCCSEGWTADVV
jgi:hypothetical protein